MSKFKKEMPSEFELELERDIKKTARNIMFWVLGLSVVILGLRIFSLVFFKEPRFDKYVCTIVRNHLWWDIAMLVLCGTLTTILAVQLFGTTKNGKKKKKKRKKKFKPLWEYWEYIFLTALVVMFVFQTREVVQIALDMKNESYVVYNGEFVQINSNGIRYHNSSTTRLEPEDIRLRSLNYHLEDGTFVGTVIYTERSEIVVEIKDVVPKN